MFQLNGLTDCFTLCFRLYEEQVEDVEGGASLQEHGVGDVGVGVGAAAVHDDVLGGGHAVALPLHVLHEVGQVAAVHAHVDVHLGEAQEEEEEEDEMRRMGRGGARVRENVRGCIVCQRTQCLVYSGNTNSLSLSHTHTDTQTRGLQ